MEGKRVPEVDGDGGIGEAAQQAGFVSPNYVLNTIKKAHSLVQLMCIHQNFNSQNNTNNIKRLIRKGSGAGCDSLVRRLRWKNCCEF